MPSPVDINQQTKKTHVIVRGQRAGTCNKGGGVDGGVDGDGGGDSRGAAVNIRHLKGSFISFIGKCKTIHV